MLRTHRSKIVLSALVTLGIVPLGVLRAAGTETVTYYYTDNRGTVLAEADAQGNVLSTADYRPFGTQVLGMPTNGPGYTGHVNDADSALIYMQARYYDPAVGRFLSVDPASGHAGNVDEFNLYSYVANNPVRRTDPDGKQTVEDYAKLSSCPVQCSLVHDSTGQWIAVPTVVAGKSLTASELKTDIGALNEASGKQIAQGTDVASAAASGASIAAVSVPPVAVALDAVGTGFAMVSLVADPSADHAMNVATAGMFGVAKTLAKENEAAKAAVEAAETTQKMKDVTDQAQKLDDANRSQ
jgi:RHS repeat-associated protein